MKNKKRILILSGVAVAIVAVAVIWLINYTMVHRVIPLDEEHFPDEDFREYIGKYYDGEHDGVLTYEERKRVYKVNTSLFWDDEKSEMIRSGQMQANLKGIEYFPWLKELYITYLDLKELDVSRYKELRTLNCSGNQLSKLDLSHNRALTMLYCHDNDLTELDLSHNKDLFYLSCAINELTTLDLRRNTALKYLECGANRLTALDLSRNEELDWVGCWENQLTVLDVSHNTALTYIDCEGNELTSLDVSNNPVLKRMDCTSNQISELDLTNTNMLGLCCDKGVNVIGAPERCTVSFAEE